MTIKQPLLHFLMLGALFFGARQWWTAAPDTSLLTIEISAGDVQRLRADWLRDTARVPSEAQLYASLQRHVDEEILLREALAAGLDIKDKVARERLIANMRFAFPESRKTDDELLRDARELGLNVRDIVVRRRLVQLMEMRIVGQADVTEQDLRSYVAAHPERYANRPRYAFRQVFINMDAVPRDAERRAQTLLEQLRKGSDVNAPGDPFLLGADFAPQSSAELDRAFGAGFGQALAALPPGAWAGPLRSAYGLHLVRIERVERGAPADFASVSARAAYALLAERERTVLREELTRLRQRYRIESPRPEAAAVTVGMAP